VWFVGEVPSADVPERRGGPGDEEAGQLLEGGVRAFAGLPKTASGKVMKHVLRRWSAGLAARGVGRVGSGGS
jgi:hypothetical protein